jgi:molybdate transport system ATP-binding protein
MEMTGAAGLHCRIRKALPGAVPFVLEAEFVAAPGISILFGASGAGKTMLLNCVAGLATPDIGRIQVGDRVFFDSSSRTDLPVAQRRLGYVFQDLALFPHLSARENIEFGLHGLPAAERHRRSGQILESFRVGHLASRKPVEISGGERQRVALARALVTDPCILLLDEPLSGLDLPSKSRIVDDLRAWNEHHRIPIIYVTHNRDEVFALGERIFVLEQGRLTADGTPHEIMSAPHQETVALLAGFENILAVTVSALHEDRGTMTCVIRDSAVEVALETPLVRARVGGDLRVGIRAGDILISTTRPVGLSARNLIAGRVVSVTRRDMVVSVIVDSGVPIEVHLTLAARDDLQLIAGRVVWLVVKTHSCHLMAQG